MANLYCDNYKTCNSYTVDRGSYEATSARARAAGWHIFIGTDHADRPHKAILCGHCVDSRRRALSPAPETLRGQQELFSIEATIGAP